MKLCCKNSPTALSLVLLCALNIGGCGSSDSTTDTSTDTEVEVDTGTESSGNYQSYLFDTAAIAEDEVECTLENGSTTTCYELTFSANTVGDTEGAGTVGPYCPPDINTYRSESGVGIYDGTTNPGFQSLVDAAISMDADGYDIVDEDGNIRFSDLSQGSEEAGFSYCLSANFDSSLELTYLIPVTPELRSEPYVLGTIDSMGVGVNGVPIKANPPSVTVVEDGVGGTGSGNIPSLDLCGGHPDPSGYYHWHFIPQSINTVYESDEYNYTEQYNMTCSNSLIEYDNPASFAGLAKDGYPIYGAYDSVDDIDTTPDTVAMVDECNGHTHETTEFPDGVYHYHALEGGAPNLPSCLMGSFVSRDVSVR
jgi:hypothetical protein